MSVDTTVTYTPKEIRAGGPQSQFLEEGVIVAMDDQAAGPLAAGTVLGRITASGKYAAYDDSANDGSETAVGILAYEVDHRAADKPASMYVRGNFVESKLVGLDANGKTDLGSRSLPSGTLLL